MFKWLKRLFCRPRLIERYEDLDAIIEAHNKLILKTNDIRDTLPPKYLLSRYNAIQEAEEKAIAAYWRNKNRKQDKWYRRTTGPGNNTMTGIPLEMSKTVAEKLAPTPPVDVLPLATSSDTQALEDSKENVIEIHINK